MTHTQWHVAITAEGVHLLTIDDQLRVQAAIPGSIRHDADTGRLALAWRLEAPSLGQATETALKTVRAALRDVLGTVPELVGCNVITIDEHEKPHQSDLIGYKEAGEILNVSRQRISELEKTHPDFPPPIARPASGPVFTKDSIEAFDKRWERKRTGRPRKNPVS